ncbi:MAG: energy transducer TonB [Laribacter sp.]|nr:energy transducer TonB [Laribacter sp.]MBP9527983.1 energy transducer TonB [Laribacter sp.]MBP9608020.1 energy transducer TonB [Laribacter sp.]
MTPPSVEPVNHAPPAASTRSPVEHTAGAVADTGAPNARPAQGGTVSAARYDLAGLNNPAPAYPASSRRLGEEGRVLLRVRVDRDGRAESVEIDTSSGFARLDEAAVTTVRQWRFAPARQGDVPVAAWARVPIRFRLDEAG